ncbi:MAG: hypothetical protein ACYCTV_03520 [Leptospirales bacterium]
MIRSGHCGTGWEYSGLKGNVQEGLLFGGKGQFSLSIHMALILLEPDV